MKKLLIAAAFSLTACAGGPPSSIAQPTHPDYSCEARTRDIMAWVREHCQNGCPAVPQVAFLPSSGVYVNITRRGADLAQITDIPQGSTAGENCPFIYGLDGPH